MSSAAAPRRVQAGLHTESVRLVVTVEGRRGARGNPGRAEDGLLFPGNPHLRGLGACPQGCLGISSRARSPAFLPVASLCGRLNAPSTECTVPSCFPTTSLVSGPAWVSGGCPGAVPGRGEVQSWLLECPLTADRSPNSPGALTVPHQSSRAACWWPRGLRGVPLTRRRKRGGPARVAWNPLSFPQLCKLLSGEARHRLA